MFSGSPLKNEVCGFEFRPMREFHLMKMRNRFNPFLSKAYFIFLDNQFAAH